MSLRSSTFLKSTIDDGGLRLLARSLGFFFGDVFPLRVTDFFQRTHHDICYPRLTLTKGMRSTLPSAIAVIHHAPKR